MKQSTIKPWHQVVQLHDEITNQELSQKQFAADLYDVVMGRNPGVYHNPREFFALTYPTVRLRDLARDVKDLVGALAATTRLPKMLNRSAILETLLQGCEAGEFVLRVTRADKSSRTFWKRRPDDQAIQEPSLEVVLPDAATLDDLDPQLLTPGKLPGLWEKEPVTLIDLGAYFSGQHFVEVDKGGYTENLSIPACTPQALTDAVAGAVKSGQVWLVNGTISVLAEEVPAGFINRAVPK